MFIIQIASEFATVAKVGGLADVVQGLSRELSIRGHHVEVILPKYDVMKYDRIWGFHKCYSDLWVPFHHFWVHCDVFFGFVDGVKCFFIEPHFFKNFFNRGIIYGHNDDDERFAFFSKAALEFMLKTNKHPDIIHVHDWQTGLVPVMLFETYKHFGMTHPRVCYTIHNIHHQGITGEHILRQIGMNPAHYMTMDRLQDPRHHNAVNIMKGGIVFSNFVTTVSPTYMHEIMWTGLGHGLQGVLQYYRNKCGGVLNGIDYNEWNPEVDRFIPHRYSLNNLDDKYKNKEALRNRFWLRHDFKPIIAVVSRLDHQKGVGLIRHAIFYALANGCQFVLLGTSPDPGISHDFWNLKRHLNDNPDCHLELSFDEYLSHLIFAGADMILVPSAFEPCGLTQMIGLKYGTVPVVRNTGGLADTVFDANYAHKPYHERNGYVFNDLNNEGLESALRRAIGMWYHYPQYWRELMVNGMRQDHSWNHPAQHYLNIYEYIREK
ncbi:MAG: glycogen synthase [Kiritimatiellae bacterium]|nr:glycogen synthase [Kiritimatiellia bacterium]MDW8457739.1 glycogen synthase [Verrucomicrobiota bacterium]